MQSDYESAFQFISNLTHDEKLELATNLTSILATTRLKITRQKNSLFAKAAIRYAPLLQFINNRNEELIIREIHEVFLFQEVCSIEVILNFKEQPYEFIQTLYDLLQRDLVPLREFA